MARSRGIGIGLALLCLFILGAMPVLAANRPARFDGLTFTIAITVWQLVAAMPLFAIDLARCNALPKIVSRGRAGLITLLTGVLFGLSTYMFVVAAEKA